MQNSILMFESFSYASFLNCFRRAPDHDFVVIAVHVDTLEGSSCWLVLISVFFSDSAVAFSRRSSITFTTHSRRDRGKRGKFLRSRAEVIWAFTLDFEAEDAGDWAVGCLAAGRAAFASLKALAALHKILSI